MNKYFIEDGGLIVIEEEDFNDFKVDFPKEENGEIKHHLGIYNGLDLLEYLVVFGVITQEDIRDYMEVNNE